MQATGNEEIFTTWTSDLSSVDASVVCLCGELDASSAPSFLADLRETVTRRRHLIMDVHLLSYTDSTGVAAILSIKHAQKEAGRDLLLVGCHGLIEKIIHAIGVADDLACFDDLDEAIEALKKQSAPASAEC